MKIATLILLVLASFTLTNAHAAEGAFFATGSFEYQFQGSDILEPGCTTYDQLQFVASGNPFTLCTGKNPRAEFKLGYEFAFGDYQNHWWLPIMQFGYKHESNWTSGAPFNKDRELWSDSLFLEFKIGGLR